ncbi:MAG: hypothetical protein WCF60_16630 [Anaerobacillus sp.]
MNIFKKVNYILAIFGVGIGVTHFLFKDIQLPTYIMSSFLLVFFLLIGIEKVKASQVKSGYFYIGAAIIMSLAVMKNLFSNLS